MDGTGRSPQAPGALVPRRPDSRLRALPSAHLDRSPSEDGPHTPSDSSLGDGTDPAEAPDQDEPVRQAAEAFAAALIRLRTAAGLSQQDLAERLRYDRSYVTHLECCSLAPTQPVARQADQFFGSGETLTRLWRAYHTARTASRGQPQRHQPAAGTEEGPGPDAAAAGGIPHDADEHAFASSAPEADSSGQPGVSPGFDLRGATGVMFGNGNTQHITR